MRAWRGAALAALLAPAAAWSPDSLLVLRVGSAGAPPFSGALAPLFLDEVLTGAAYAGLPPASSTAVAGAALPGKRVFARPRSVPLRART